MSSYSINVGDTDPLRVRIVQALGEPSDLSVLDAVMIHIMTREGVHVLGPKPCLFAEGDGIVQYDWGFGETDTDGTYSVQFDLRQAMTTANNGSNAGIPVSDSPLMTEGEHILVVDASTVGMPGTPQQLSFVASTPISNPSFTLHLEGTDVWDVHQVEEQEWSSGAQFDFSTYWKTITLAKFIVDPGGQADAITMTLVGGPQKVTSAVHGRAPARGYLDLFIQPKVP